MTNKQLHQLLKPRHFIFKTEAYGLLNGQCFLHAKCVHELKERVIELPGRSPEQEFGLIFQKKIAAKCVQDSETVILITCTSPTVITFRYKAHYNAY